MNVVISTNERAWFLPGHLTFKLRYNQIYQMKTTNGITNTKFEFMYIVASALKIKKTVYFLL